MINKLIHPVMGKYAYGDFKFQSISEFNLIKRSELNSEFHRTIEPEEITSPYILVCGCSMSAGESITKEQTYSSLLSNNLNLPVYNLSIGGSGCDFIALNVKHWITNFPIKPTLVIIQWSFPSTRFVVLKNEEAFLLGPWTIDKNFRHKLWLKEYEMQKLYYDNIDNILEISKTSRSSLLDFLNETEITHLEIILDDDSFDIPNIFYTTDRGTDGAHPGPETHLNISNRLTELCNKNFNINK
jgi:hypothetical protein